MVDSLPNISVLQECLSFSWCLKIKQVALLFAKVGIWIRFPFIYWAFDLSLLGNCWVCFDHFECLCSEQLNLAVLDFWSRCEIFDLNYLLMAVQTFVGSSLVFQVLILGD